MHRTAPFLLPGINDLCRLGEKPDPLEVDA